MTADPTSLTIICATFLLAGAVKGVIGLGLPSISLGLLTAMLDLPSAMALMIVPALVTNLVQATSGGQMRRIIRQIWPFLLAATLTIWIGAQVLTRLDFSFLYFLLGLILTIYSCLNLAGFRLQLSSLSCTQSACWHAVRCCERHPHGNDRVLCGAGRSVFASDRLVARCSSTSDGHSFLTVHIGACHRAQCQQSDAGQKRLDFKPCSASGSAWHGSGPVYPKPALRAPFQAGLFLGDPSTWPGDHGQSGPLVLIAS